MADVVMQEALAGEKCPLEEEKEEDASTEASLCAALTPVASQQSLFAETVEDDQEEFTFETKRVVAAQLASFQSDGCSHDGGLGNGCRVRRSARVSQGLELQPVAPRWVSDADAHGRRRYRGHVCGTAQWVSMLRMLFQRVGGGLQFVAGYVGFHGVVFKQASMANALPQKYRESWSASMMRLLDSLLPPDQSSRVPYHSSPITGDDSTWRPLGKRARRFGWQSECWTRDGGPLRRVPAMSQLPTKHFG